VGEKLRVFVSSSSDVRDARVRIDARLRSWFQQAGLADEIQPYLWEEETEKGSILSDRQAIQTQIPDPMAWSIPFTVCIFGERCGVPLSKDLPAEWYERLEDWLATDDEPGLKHPWPEDPAEQDAQLDRGNFPLTGTVFELISACSVDEDYRNLIVGYSASLDVQFASSFGEIDFNHRKERARIRQPGNNDIERNKLEASEYTPQVRALFNLLKYLAGRQKLTCYRSEEEMAEQVLLCAERELRKHFNVESENNPFKLSLTHFGVDDTNEVPGRKAQIDKALGYANNSADRSLVLITGSSGCGKSSILQRGVLGKMQEKGARVLAVRPSDLDDMGQSDRLDMLWEMICERIDGCHITRLGKHKRDAKMAERLARVLGQRAQDLVLGLDQFEEMLDEMRLFSERKHRQRGWWLVLNFLQKISSSPHIKIFATLESSREDTFKALKIEEVIGLPWDTVSAEVDADVIEAIAVDGFDRGGFELDSPLRREIKEKWTEFSKNPGTATTSASLLPLAALWMAQLFEKFEDQAAPPVTSGTALTDALEDATHEKPKLTLQEIGGKDAVNFKGVIGKLADDAWRDALDEAPPSGSVEENREAYVGINGVFDTLVALDDGVHMRLLSGPRAGPGKYYERIFDRFVEQRLLVPAGRKGRVRLVHQAIVDHWGPAKAWFAWRKSYLKLEQEMRNKALAWDREGQQSIAVDQSLAQAAGQVLDANKEWTSQDPSGMSKQAAALRAYCCEALAQAPDLSEVVETSLFGSSLAHVAAAYQLSHVLVPFLRQNPKKVRISTQDGRTPVYAAAWDDGPVIEEIMECTKKKVRRSWARIPDSKGPHPIAVDIQEKANRNFEALLALYDNPNELVLEEDITMLGMASMVDNADASRVLLSHPKIDPRKGDESENPPISYAAHWGSTKVFELLLPYIEPPREGHLHPLHEAARSGHGNIIRLFMESDEIDDDAREKVLRHKAIEYSNTPLMEAAENRKPDALAELLQPCDPTEDIHRDSKGRTLFHLILQWHNTDTPTADDQRRALKCIEILVKTDLDPMILAYGKTALEMGHAFPQAQRVLRKHMPFDYASMSDSLKKQDLTSSNPKDYRRVLSQAPQVLRDKINGKTGIDTLIEAKRTDALRFALEMDDAPMPVIRRKWSELIHLAAETRNAALQKAILKRLPASSKVNLSLLLDAALRERSAQSAEVVETLRYRGVRLTSGTGELGMTVFHQLARSGHLERFETLAQGQEYKLPMDDWGRAPSDVAAPNVAEAIAALEATHFTGKPRQWKHAADKAPYHPIEQEPGPKPAPQLRRRVLGFLRKIPNLPKADSRRTRILAFRAPFYRASTLIVATNPAWDDGQLQICYLQRGSDLIRLLGKSPPIHEFNAKFKTKITPRHAQSYLAFFCFFVRGEEGPFLIVDRPNNAYVPPEIGGSDDMGKCPSVKLWGTDDRGYIRASATVFYSNALFVSDFLIQPSGMIEMVDDQPVAADLSHCVYAPISVDE